MRVVITGARGMLGSSLRSAWASLRQQDEVVSLTRTTVDLTDRDQTRRAIAQARPDLVVHAAARVGGIQANIADPTGFLLDNLLIDTSVISAALAADVPGLVYVGSSCMYPRDHRQPLVESDILAGPLEPTNEGYAIAKIAGARLCAYASAQFGLAYRVVIPSNLYGPLDDFSPARSHLIPAIIAKLHEAKVSGAGSVAVWGSGNARREFTYAPDVADWIVGSIDELAGWPQLMNIGYGQDFSVREFYEMGSAAVGYEGGFDFDLSRPEGMQRKLMDSTLARQAGWQPRTSPEEGMRATYTHFLSTLTGAAGGDPR